MLHVGFKYSPLHPLRDRNYCIHEMCIVTILNCFVCKMCTENNKRKSFWMFWLFCACRWISHSKVLMSLQKLVKFPIRYICPLFTYIVYKIYILWWLDVLKMIIKKFKNNLFLFIKDISDEWENMNEAKVETGAQVHITKLLT